MIRAKNAPTPLLEELLCKRAAETATGANDHGLLHVARLMSRVDQIAVVPTFHRQNRQAV